MLFIEWLHESTAVEGPSLGGCNYNSKITIFLFGQALGIQSFLPNLQVVACKTVYVFVCLFFPKKSK